MTFRGRQIVSRVAYLGGSESGVKCGEVKLLPSSIPQPGHSAVKCKQVYVYSLQSTSLYTAETVNHHHVGAELLSSADNMEG